nr:histidine phosphatase family protein [Paenibacillus sp. JCM 10914]
MIDAIIAVQRAKITDYIAQATNAPVTVDDRLRERRLGGSA